MSTVNSDRLRVGSVPVHKAHHDPTGEEPLSATVIRAVAAAKGVDPTDCDLELYEAVDLEALDTLFEGRSRDGRWRFEFSIADHLVVVEGDGSVTIYES
jgi:hypothetical protein